MRRDGKEGRTCVDMTQNEWSMNPLSDLPLQRVAFTLIGHTHRGISLGILAVESHLPYQTAKQCASILAGMGRVLIYHSPGRPTLYYWKGPRSRDLVKSAMLFHYLQDDIPLNNSLI